MCVCTPENRTPVCKNCPATLKAADPKIENNFSYHPPKPGHPEKYEELRSKAKELAYLILDLCPPSRERSLAETKLEESLMWANASIARNE